MRHLFSFEIYVPSKEWKAVYESEKNKQLMKEEKIICLYRDIKKEYRCTANLLEQAEESKSITMFSNHEGRPLIKEVGFIYDSTVITSYSKIN